MEGLRIVYDIECDALSPYDVTQVHCIAAKDLDSGEEWFYDPTRISVGVRSLEKARQLVSHNGIHYDNVVLARLCKFVPTGTVIDTLVVSRLLNPDRRRPFGMEGTAGPHSVEAWGYRLGRHKVEYTDWSKYTEEMGRRCMEDTRIQYLMYHALVKEANE